MNLKKIELYGFKSFADKLEIEFESNITCIVGPNGCGKSNVADAVRWVLGEQSPSALRCKKMPEIIFNGTANRRSISYCEVSLYLDNEKRQYPIDFDEVVITRKLDRSGDSEYYINRNACRWRDIIDLFRDSGIGREGYSIIGQGKIEEILSAKPEARRQIFEEAAGISRHKARKIDTERRLDRTRDNISRLNDIITEISSGLEPLEHQAKVAANARELKKQLKQLEIHFFLYQCENSATEREKIRTRLNRCVADIAELEKQLSISSRDYNVTMMDITNSDIYAKGLRDKITELLLQSERVQGDSRVLAERLENLQKDAANLINERSAAEARYIDRQREAEQKLSLYNEKNALLIEKKEALAAFQQEFDAAQAETDKQERELQKLNELRFDQKDKLSLINENRAKLELERSILTDNIAAAKEEHALKNRKLTEAEAVYRELSARYDELDAERKAKQKDKTAADANLADANAELRDTELKLRRHEDTRKELEVKKNLLESIKREHEGYQNCVRKLLVDADRDPSVRALILGSVPQVITVPRDYQIAIEAALGAATNHLITENEYDASKLIDYLRRKGYGTATFLPLTTVRANPLPVEHQRVLDEDGVVGIASELIRYDRKYHGIFSSLLGRTVIVEDKEVGIEIAKRYHYKFKIVSLDGVVFATTGSLTGGSRSVREGKLLGRDGELQEIYKRIKNVEKEIELLSEDVKEREIESKKIAEAARIIDAQLHKAEVDVKVIVEKINNAEAEVGIYRGEVGKLTQQIEEYSKRIAELNDLLKQAAKAKGDVENESVDADDFVNALRERYYAAKEKRDRMSETLSDRKIEVSTLISESESLKSELTSISAERQMLTDTIRSLKAQYASLEERIETTKRQVDTTRFTPEQQSELDGLKGELDSLEEHKQKMQAKITELDEAKTVLTQKINEVNEKRVREEGALERIDSDIDNMSQRINEAYGLDFEGAKQYKAETEDPEAPFVFDPSKAAAETASLRRKIERMGPVNELAEETFRTESERYADFKKQYDDLVKAEQELMQIIADLTKEMTDKFVESFKQINVNFQEVFRELFGGGQARLQLETGEGVSVLDAGIEIMAEPPGKHLTRISLMSGGERALTAIAILFAIIKLKPMPFSILDEIEAALDEANASLYAQYLRKFSSVTQFIVVTHRKPTMELADMLYGVTMQEKGVSKLVRVKLEDAVKSIEEGE